MTARRFESVWDAIENTQGEAANMKLRAQLMRALEQCFSARGWTQQEAATHCGVTQPRISDLVRGKIDLFSLDMLVNMAAAAGVGVELHMVAA